jgi:uncharacterized protein YijF (DUF1287 family)
MKKIAYLLSALSAALFSTAANADVSVGGSASLAYSGASGNTTILQGGAVSFGLSTTTDSGMTISSSAGITRDTDAAGSAAVTGLSALTLATGGATIKIGYDIGLADGTAAVGEIVTVADHNSNGVTNTGGMGDDEGAGISLSTTFGDAALSVVYVYDKTAGASAPTSGDLDGAANTGTSVSVTLPMGPASVTGTYVSGDVSNTTDTESALTASYATDAGTFKVGYASFDGDTTSINGTTFGLSYAMDFDGTSVKLGYQSYDVNSTSGNSTDVVVSRPLGGGASLFAEMRSTGGTVGTTSTKSTSTIAVGTSVSF